MWSLKPEGWLDWAAIVIAPLAIVAMAAMAVWTVWMNARGVVIRRRLLRAFPRMEDLQFGAVMQGSFGVDSARAIEARRDLSALIGIPANRIGPEQVLESLLRIPSSPGRLIAEMLGAHLHVVVRNELGERLADAEGTSLPVRLESLPGTVGEYLARLIKHAGRSPASSSSPRLGHLPWWEIVALGLLGAGTVLVRALTEQGWWLCWVFAAVGGMVYVFVKKIVWRRRGSAIGRG